MEKHLTLIDAYREDIIRSLQELLAFDSVVQEGGKGGPFGAEVQKCLDYMLHMAENDGFRTVNTDNKGGHIEMGEGEEIVGVLVHLDIVPVGEGWEHEPFGAEITDGNLYGRGTMDDKGPAIMAYYAMKALKEAAAEVAAEAEIAEGGEEAVEASESFRWKRRVRLILGLDEEKGAWKGMPHYIAKVGSPDIGFTPDSTFPCIHAEMGILIFELVKKLGKVNKTAGNVLKSIKGGSAHNMVPDRCTAVISSERGYDEEKRIIAEFAEETGYKVSAKGRGRALEIISEGVAAHGGRPFHGLNAISIMMALLGRMEIQGDETQEFIEFYNGRIGFDLNGEKIGCGLSDEISGKLLFNVGIIDVGDETAALTIGVRYPVTAEGDAVYDGMRETVDACGLGVVKIEDKKPIYFPPDSSLVTMLTEVYQKHTGDMESKPLVISGGTYARAAENIIAFGPAWPGEVERQHKKNEFIEVDRVISTAKIYADAILRLAMEN